MAGGCVNNRSQSNRSHQLRNAGTGRAGGNLFEQVAANIIGNTVKAAVFIILTAVDFYNAFTINAFAQDLHQLAKINLVVGRQFAQAFADCLDTYSNNRQDDKSNQGQTPVQISQQAQQADYAHAVFGNHGNDVKPCIGNLIDVVQDTRHQTAAGIAAEIRSRQVHHFVEHFTAQALH